MHTSIPCPNPVCTHAFSPDAVKNASSLVCPKCGSVFHFGSSAPARPSVGQKTAPPSFKPNPPLPKPPPLPPSIAAVPMAQPVAAQVPIAAVPSSAGLNFNSTPDMVVPRARRPAAQAGKRWAPRIALTVVGLLALVLIVWGAKRLMHSTETSDDDPGRAADVYNCRFAWPGKPWTRQTNLQQNLHVHIGMTSPQHHSSFALFFKDYKTRTPSDAEMLYEALSRLRSYFNGLEWEEIKSKDEAARLASQPAKVFEFRGDDAEEVTMNGQCHMMTWRGYGYWFFTWAPFDELRTDGEPIRAEWTRMRQRLTLLDGRKGWMAKPPETQTVQGTKAKYQLSHLKSLWTRETAEGYDPSADLVLKGHYPEDSDGKPLASNDATFQVLVLPKQANLKAAAAAAREYLKKQEEELYPGIKMEPIKDKGGEVDRVGDIGQESGQLSKLNVMKTEELEHFLFLAVVNRPEGVIVLVGDCLWERRDYWDQEFAALLSTFKIQGR